VLERSTFRHENTFAAAERLTARAISAFSPRVQLMHFVVNTRIPYLIIQRAARKMTACRVHCAFDVSSFDETNTGDIPMKKILIALTALGMFVAFSGIARAQDDATKTDTTTTKKTKKKKAKTDEAGATDTTKTEKTDTKKETTK
jgi:hypothetical protein